MQGNDVGNVVELEQKMDLITPLAIVLILFEFWIPINVLLDSLLPCSTSCCSDSPSGGVS